MLCHAPGTAKTTGRASNLAEVTIPLRSHEEAILVLGPYDRHAKLLRQVLDIEIFTRNGNLRLKGSEDHTAEARRRIEHLLGKLRKGRDVDAKDAEAILVGASSFDLPSGISPTSFPSASPAAPKPTGFGGGADRAVERGQGIGVRSARPVSSTGFRMRPFEPRGVRQRKYVELIAAKPLTFGLGAAGTGKTYLAVAWRCERCARRMPSARDHAPRRRSRREARLPARRPARRSSIRTCGRCTTRWRPARVRGRDALEERA
jgi:hypothetical protein